MKKIVIGMAAEVDAGKTTLSEALLFHAGAIRSMGRVDNRNTFFDTRGAERERGIDALGRENCFTESRTRCDIAELRAFSGMPSHLLAFE